jgi:FtsP/CotA-like multicopper oxidase with cupredoxin domain
MNESSSTRRFSRRDLLKLGGLGALAAGAGTIPVLAGRSGPRALAVQNAVLPAAARFDMRLAATDGYIKLPGRGIGGGNEVYNFGFVRVPVGVTPDELDVYKGVVQFTAPIIGVDEESDVYLTLTNIGFVVRPDLDDSHTIHWHGFPNASAIFDGVPEVSIAVPVGADFPYYYNPHRVGTFMYHCHFEDVEHVQMGMQGIVYVRPSQNGNMSLYPSGKYAYNDGNGSTGYDREFALLLDEIWTTPHDNGESIQETVWPNYHPNYWVINGRTYPQTLLQNNDPSLLAQPLSSLIQVNEGDQVLLRFANLGYEQQSMQLPGIPMTVVGEDATFLGTSYPTNTIYIGPGEARDVIFSAPTFDPLSAVIDDQLRPYNAYSLRNRDIHRLTNKGVPGLGGQATEVRVYGPVTLADQTHPNETYPESAPTPPYMDPWIVSP